MVREQGRPALHGALLPEPGGQVLYAKALRCKDVTTQIRFTYPAAEKPTGDRVAAKCQPRSAPDAAWGDRRSGLSGA